MILYRKLNLHIKSLRSTHPYHRCGPDVCYVTAMVFGLSAFLHMWKCAIQKSGLWELHMMCYKKCIPKK